MGRENSILPSPKTTPLRALDSVSRILKPPGMKQLVILAAMLPALVLPVRSAEPVTATFYITDVKCGSCASSIEDSVRKLPTVTKIESLGDNTGFALITFDPKVVSYHQVAQAVFAAAPVHGDPYVATLKFTIPDYAKGDNAAKVDAIFARHKKNVQVELKNKERGKFLLHFEPLTVSSAAKGPQGWNLDQFISAIQEPAPKGLGLAFEVASEK